MTSRSSLNYSEIDLILEELDLPGYRIQEIAQPTPKELVLDLYKTEGKQRLYFGFHPNGCRLHFYHGDLPKNRTPQRFVSFLRAHIRNGRILSAEHVFQERIILLKIQQADNTYNFWIRMWTNAPNIIVTNQEQVILDAMFRRPKRNEISGTYFNPMETLSPTVKDPIRFPVRELPGDGSFQERLEKYFSECVATDETESLKEHITNILSSREAKSSNTLKQIQKNLEECGSFERLREIADLIQSNISHIKPGDRWLACEDYYNNNAKTEIELNPQKTAIENAEEYYNKFKKAKIRYRYLLQDKQSAEEELDETLQLKHEFEATQDVGHLRELDRKLKKSGTKTTRLENNFPGRKYSSSGFTLIVGRTASENEELLRKYVRGNDYWLHTRDAAGAYIFIKNKPGKSVPLDVLLDAGNLAIHFSKAKASGKADLYYTQVKYLKKVKGAKKGFVLATQEKNLSITLDKQRINRLLNE